MQLKTKIISSGPVKKTLQDYLPKLTPEQWAERERCLLASGIVRSLNNMSDEIWELFIVYHVEVIKVARFAGAKRNVLLAEITTDILIKMFSIRLNLSYYSLDPSSETFRRLVDLTRVLVEPSLASIEKSIARHPDLAKKPKELARIAVAAKYSAVKAFDHLDRLIDVRPELAAKLSEMAELAELGKEFTYTIYYLLAKFSKSRSDLVEGPREYVELFRELKWGNRENTNVNESCFSEACSLILALIDASSHLEEKLEGFVGVIGKIKKAVGLDVLNSYINFRQIIEAQSDLANRSDKFILLAEKFKEKTSDIYMILKNMIDEGLVAEDNFERTVQQLLEEGEKALELYRGN